MRLDCILDLCPADGEFVNHLKCVRCKHNPLGIDQPATGEQECRHMNAKHDPKPERWQTFKAMAGTLHMTMVEFPGQDKSGGMTNGEPTQKGRNRNA